MDVGAALGTNERKETEGVWFEMGDARLLVAGFGSSNYRDAEIEVARAMRLAGALDDNSKTSDLEYQMRVWAKALLLRIENIKDNGVEVEDTEQGRYQLLMNYPRLRIWVERRAENPANYRLSEDEEKN